MYRKWAKEVSWKLLQLFHQLKQHVLPSLHFPLFGTLSPALFLTAKQVSGATDINLSNVPSYFILIYIPQLNIAYLYAIISLAYAYDLDSTKFSTIWLGGNCHSITKFIYALYFSQLNRLLKILFWFQSRVHCDPFPPCWDMYLQRFQCSTANAILGLYPPSLTNLVNKLTTLFSLMS